MNFVLRQRPYCDKTRTKRTVTAASCPQPNRFIIGRVLNTSLSIRIPTLFVIFPFRCDFLMVFLCLSDGFCFRFRVETSETTASYRFRRIRQAVQARSTRPVVRLELRTAKRGERRNVFPASAFRVEHPHAHVVIVQYANVIRFNGNVIISQQY